MIQEIHAILRDEANEELIFVKVTAEIDPETSVVNTADLSGALMQALLYHYNFRPFKGPVLLVHARVIPARAIEPTRHRARGLAKAAVRLLLSPLTLFRRHNVVAD